jgi:hypothetical protein
MLAGETYAVSPDGTRMVSQSLGVFAGAGNDVLNKSVGTQYESVREDGGWVTRALAPPAASYTTGALLDTSADVADSLWLLHAPERPSGVEELYIRSANGAFARVGPGTTGFTPTTNTPAPNESTVTYLGASGDLEHLLISAESSSDYSLWRGDTSVTADGVVSLYEYTGTGNSEPTLVGVENGRLEGRSYVNEGAKLISNCGTVLGGREGETSGTTMYNAISESGDTVFFTAVGLSESAGRGCGSAARHYEECEHEGHSRRECEERSVPEPLGPPPRGPLVSEVYARIDGSATVPISEPLLSVPGRDCTESCATDETTEALRSEGLYEGASQDGSKVFFTTEQPLVNADRDVANGEENHARDLYEAELGMVEEAGVKKAGVTRLVMVSRGEAGDQTPGAGAEVQGVVRISEDGSHVYFVAKGKLTGAKDAGGDEAQVGADNLYVFDTASERLSFVAPLNGNRDAELWNHGDGPAEATPDGRFLVFKSGADLTGDDTSGEEAPQIFEYDAETGSLTRVSIGQRGDYVCLASGKIEAGYNCDGNTSDEEDAPIMQQPSYGSGDDARTSASTLTVSNDGSTVVFESRDSLTPLAIAGDVNVYEYRAGELYLISDGHDATEVGSFGKSASQLLSIDGTGEDIFFATGEALVPQDTDTEVDFYDARVDGGFPGPAVTIGCGEGCQGELGTGPVLVQADSESTAGEQGSTVTSVQRQSASPKHSSRLESRRERLARCKAQRGKKRKACEVKVRHEVKVHQGPGKGSKVIGRGRRRSK